MGRSEQTFALATDVTQKGIKDKRKVDKQQMAGPKLTVCALRGGSSLQKTQIQQLSVMIVRRGWIDGNMNFSMSLSFEERLKELVHAFADSIS